MLTQADSSSALTAILRQCETAVTPTGLAEFTRRQRRSILPLPHDSEIMRRICVAIAYSQGARSAQIGPLTESTVFAMAFVGFDPVRLARRNPKHILDRYWNRLGHFRFRAKVSRIVECAKVLNGIIRDRGSFSIYLQSFGIPRRIRSQVNLDQFWRQFDELQRDLTHRRMPFFRSTTSLLQLLLDLDYDSVKPDLIVMRLARRIGIVERETGDRAFRACVQFLQTYSIQKSCRASELDLALLAFGGQSGASQLLSQKFCPPTDPCNHRSCPVAENGLCMACQTPRAS